MISADISSSLNVGNHLTPSRKSYSRFDLNILSLNSFSKLFTPETSSEEGRSPMFWMLSFISSIEDQLISLSRATLKSSGNTKNMSEHQFGHVTANEAKGRGSVWWISCLDVTRSSSVRGWVDFVVVTAVSRWVGGLRVSEMVKNSLSASFWIFYSWIGTGYSLSSYISFKLSSMPNSSGWVFCCWGIEGC